MGIATLSVLAGSNLVISLVRNVIPAKVRIPCFILIVATFVTVVDLLMRAFAPALNDSLGIFIPLIVVNCIILGRAEAFASKNGPLYAVADGLGMGLGFTLSLSVISSIRELIGFGSLTVWSGLSWHIPNYTAILLTILPPGGFITLGCLLAGINRLEIRKAEKEGRIYIPPSTDCRSCVIGCGIPREDAPLA